MFNVDNDLDMPRDVIHGECLCQIIGRNEIVIGHRYRNCM